DRGATVVHRSGRVTSAAFDVPIDNPTGCGDVFNAAYVYARLAGASLPDALRFGNAAAALHLRDRRRPYPSGVAVRRLARTSTRP
ncbi:MAG TPA: PfkB family carbohydrate kinase, partial [Thermoplasmata archaeon]|nr:PfkB family carbohydrate kinase [Thermoplasmata archaeon]